MACGQVRKESREKSYLSELCFYDTPYKKEQIVPQM